MAQSISGVITALFAACQTLYANTTGADNLPVLVSLGAPGKYQPASLVAIGFDVRMPISRPTMGPNRSREQDAEIDVVMSAWVAGDEDSQATATTNALGLMSQLETYLRTSPNEKLGGACVDSWVANCAMVQHATYQAQEDPAMPLIPTGRTTDLTVTVSTRIRY